MTSTIRTHGTTTKASASGSDGAVCLGIPIMTNTRRANLLDERPIPYLDLPNRHRTTIWMNVQRIGKRVVSKQLGQFSHSR